MDTPPPGRVPSTVPRPVRPDRAKAAPQVYTAAGRIHDARSSTYCTVTLGVKISAPNVRRVAVVSLGGGIGIDSFGGACSDARARLLPFTRCHIAAAAVPIVSTVQP